MWASSSSALVYIKEKRPRLAIFENAPSLLSKQFRAVFIGIKSPLQKLDYIVHAGKLSSADCGVAQARARLFVVSIRRDSVKHKFSWPQKRKAVALSSVLDPRRPKEKLGRLPSSARGKNWCKAA